MWRRKTVRKLIKGLREREILWNPKHPTLLKTANQAFSELEQLMEMPAMAISAKIGELMSKFCRELQRMINKAKRGNSNI